MENQVEIWKAHPDIVGIEVSSFGRVRTLDRVGSRENGTYSKKGHVLKQRDNGIGYLQVGIQIDGKRNEKLVHRLVAQTFIANPDNLPDANHKNCIRNDNRVSNLEWCSRSYNMQYREKFGEASGRPVFAINLSTLEVLHFRAQREASRELGANQGSINAVIKGRLNKTHGFWFTNDDNNADGAIKRKLNEIGKI